MKHLKSFGIAMAMLATLSFVSCNKDDSPAAEKQFTPQDIVGRWVVVSTDDKDASYFETHAQTYQFNSESEGKGRFYSDITNSPSDIDMKNGRYQLGDCMILELFITNDDGEDTPWGIFKVEDYSGENMKWINLTSDKSSNFVILKRSDFHTTK